MSQPTEEKISEQLSEGPGNGGISKSEKRGTKRKLDQKPLEVKFNAIIEFEKGQKSKTEIARMFDIPKNTLSGWLKKADSIKEGFAKFGPKRRNMRQGNFEDLETALLRWFREARNQNVPISGPIMLEKAKFFADQLGIDDFKQSTGWLDRFKDRHQISFKAICGESRSVDSDSEAMDAWSVQKEQLLKRYSPRDIYNADETGLFYRLTPDKTLEFKNVSCAGGKRSKDRITVMVCANMSGDDKIPLLVIGKSANPRCFKNVKTLPTQYENNKKAWMTSEIFKKWLTKLDKRFLRENRKVVMVIDNCPAHPAMRELKAIELVFLPPNTTSHTQPCDQGIIKNLKVHYRHQLIQRQLADIDSKSDFVFTVLDALRLLRQSWSMVTPQTISKCFRHAGFNSVSDNPYPSVSDSDDEDDIPLARVAELCKRDQCDISGYINVDLDIPVCAETSDSDIVSDLLSARNPVEDDMTQEADDQPAPEPPTLAEAMTAHDTLRRFFESENDTEHELSVMCSLYKSLFKFDLKKRSTRQTSIHDFFKH